jgi:hypothetical protein
VTDNPQDGPLVASSGVGILLYSSYITPNESDLFAICKNIECHLEPDQLTVWECVYSYDSAPFDQKGGGPQGQGNPQQGNNQQNPTARPWQLEFGSNKTTKLLTKDLNNKEVVASNGQPFDPPLEVPAAFPTITITAYKAFAVFAEVPFYTNAINSDAWQGFAPKTLRCTDYKLQTQYENGAYFWQKTVVLEVHPDSTWNPVKILDAGTFEKVSENPDKPVQPIEINGQPVTSPVPLNGAGKRLAAGAQLVYLDFQAYREVPFANII